MSKFSSNMLRTRRRDQNIKPNRRDTRLSRLDRKSSRGMIYENEELRLRTININAEIERGQYDIKKLKRENELLKKEIWCLRDEYEKLDKLLKDKQIDFSSSSTTYTTTDSDSCSSCSTTADTNEQCQNMENVQKTTNFRNLHTHFDHLSIVPEENSTENSEKSNNNNIIKPDQSYPATFDNFRLMSPGGSNNVEKLGKQSTDLIVLDKYSQPSQSTTTNGNDGDLDELLNDIEIISQDILNISKKPIEIEKPYKSELNVVLMPKPMPLLGFEKYQKLQQNFDNFKSKSMDNLTTSPNSNNDCDTNNPFIFISNNCDTTGSNSDGMKSDELGSKTNLLKLSPSVEHVSTENELRKHDNDTKLRRKLSIHFKGNKKEKPIINSASTDSTSKKSTITEITPNSNKKNEKNKHKKHKKHKTSTNSLNVNNNLRERSFSICTDRSNMLMKTSNNTNGYVFDDFHDSGEERERTNSMDGSSCDSTKSRKMSNISNSNLNSKVPWCACWGNGCL